jgi:putative DNA primase/helicase
VTWKLETDPKGGKDKKVLYNVKTGRRASSTNPADWATFEEVMKATGFGNAGFVFTADDPYCGIDLDSCRDAVTGEIEPWALKIIKRFDSYTEVSPSGTGLHILIKGQLPKGGNRKGKIEIYNQGRFFTVTGNRLEGIS